MTRDAPLAFPAPSQKSAQILRLMDDAELYSPILRVQTWDQLKSSLHDETYSVGKSRIVRYVFITYISLPLFERRSRTSSTESFN